MFDWPTVIRTEAAHLLRMVNTPGFEQHAKQRRDQMLADKVWDGLSDEIIRQQAHLSRRKADAVEVA